MKRITIGRSPGCDIVFDQNMISRNHALLNVYSSGKCEIVNMGQNGTKVNGIQITNGQPYPLKRGDAVVFANQAQLDWKQVPNPRRPWLLAIIISGAVIALGLIAWLAVWMINFDWGTSTDCPGELTEQPGGTVGDDGTAASDTTSTATTEPNDSIKTDTKNDDTGNKTGNLDQFKNQFPGGQKVNPPTPPTPPHTPKPEPKPDPKPATDEPDFGI